jgi:hypothetical protein
MKQFKHKSYEQYVEAQVIKNKRKLKNVFVKPEICDLIIKDIEKNISKCKFGICHGVRNGWEVQYFRSKLNIEVIGTEISDTATKFDNVIQWDFHKVKEEWLNNVDFIYTNSWDHSFDPKMALNMWMSCIKKNGRCYIEWTTAHNGKNDSADCFSANSEEYESIINEKYKVYNKLGNSPDRQVFIVTHI